MPSIELNPPRVAPTAPAVVLERIGAWLTPRDAAAWSQCSHAEREQARGTLERYRLRRSLVADTDPRALVARAAWLGRRTLWLDGGMTPLELWLWSRLRSTRSTRAVDPLDVIRLFARSGYNVRAPNRRGLGLRRAGERWLRVLRRHAARSDHGTKRLAAWERVVADLETVADAAAQPHSDGV